MNNEYNKFQSKVWRTGGSLVVTIPDQIVKFSSLKEGDEIKVMIKKEA